MKRKTSKSWAIAAIAMTTGPVAAQTILPGSLDPSYDPDVAGSYVSGIAVQPDGKVVIAGNFSSAGGQTRHSIARLLTSGAVEGAATFNPGTGATFWTTAAAVQLDGKIVLGGAFSSVNGQPRNRVARLLPNGNVEGTATFNPGTGANGVSSNGTVNAVALQADGKILIAGQFTTFDGQPRKGIARLLANGSLEGTATFNPGSGASTGTATEATVYCAAVQPDGKILLGGDFVAINGQARRGIARLLSNGTVESTATFNIGTGTGGGGGVSSDVFSLAVQADGKILIGGNFADVNGQARAGLARLLPNGAVESTSTFDPGPVALGVRSIALQADGRILLGHQSGVARLLANGTAETSATFNAGATAGTFVFGAALQADGRILAGGAFESVAGQPRHHLARLTNEPAVQNLAISDASHIVWFRSGTAPEVEQVTFELSTNGSSTWSPLGIGSRVAGGWELSGLNLPADGTLRARGRTTGGGSGGSSGIVESLLTFPAPVLPVLTITRADTSITVSWPFPSTGFELQQNTDLTNTNWTAPPEPVVDDATTRSITVNAVSGSRFYRLTKMNGQP